MLNCQLDPLCLESWTTFIVYQIHFIALTLFIFYFLLSQTEYHIDEQMKKNVLKIVHGAWKDFKTKLVSGWITKTRKLPENHKEPYEFYDGVTKSQWETFKKYCETEEFKVCF